MTLFISYDLFMLNITSFGYNNDSNPFSLAKWIRFLRLSNILIMMSWSISVAHFLIFRIRLYVFELFPSIAFGFFSVFIVKNLNSNSKFIFFCFWIHVFVENKSNFCTQYFDRKKLSKSVILRILLSDIFWHISCSKQGTIMYCTILEFSECLFFTTKVGFLKYYSLTRKLLKRV